MKFKLGISGIVFIVLSVLLIGGVLLSFWYKNNIEIVTEPEPNVVPIETHVPDVKPKCFVTGCSGQVCSSENVATTCEYKEEYACYKTAVCEEQSNGDCGWTMTDEVKTCLASVKN